ncbi:MAG UNVERIFIED_CONTAM: tetratricopeptide repeat-containing protein [Anaerolineae bacterium]
MPTTLRGLNWLERGWRCISADANLRRVGFLLHEIGNGYSQPGKVDEALTHFQQALTIRREVHDRSGRRDPARNWDCVLWNGKWTRR